MKTIISSILFVLILFTLSKECFSETSTISNPPSATISASPQLQVSPPDKQSLQGNQTQNAGASSLITTNKDLVVVSRTPEFYSYTLTGITVILSIVVLAVTFMAGYGATLVYKIKKENEALSIVKQSIEKEHEDLIEKLNKDCEKHISTLKLTALGLVTVHSGKNNLKNLLSEKDPSFDSIYMEVQKTIQYPDEECIRIYGKILTIYEDEIDMIRLVRNGLLQYSSLPNIQQ